jgi:CMP-N-acetylneuraminic acid synthetase
MRDMPFRRQELDELYALNGAIYLVATQVLLERQTFYTERTYAYVMPAERSLDIESQWEYTLARLILEDRQRREEAP